MAETRVPIDLVNPGHVFASLGCLEVADVLLGDAEGGFDWSNPARAQFMLRANGETNPIEMAFEFLSRARAEEDAATDVAPARMTKDDEKRRAVVLRGRSPEAIHVGHWADGSSRESFKQFAGNQSAMKIVRARLGEIQNAWKENREALIREPFDQLLGFRGSFNFDARAAWKPRDVGYSLDEQAQDLLFSPAVELLSAIGLEHARPAAEDRLSVRYAVWPPFLPPALARPILGGEDVVPACRKFRCLRNAQGPKGEYKQFTFATEEAII